MKREILVKKTCFTAILFALICFMSSSGWAGTTIVKWDDNDTDNGSYTDLHNDDGTDAEKDHVDDGLYHREYEEELELGKIEQELKYQDSELSNEDEAKLEIEIEIENGTVKKGTFSGIPDLSPRTSFFSDEHKKNDGTSIFGTAAGNNDNDFFYAHQLPPGVRPDLLTDPNFNSFDFTSDLLEFELEIEGFFNGGNATKFDVFLFDLTYDSTKTGFDDTNPILAGLTASSVDDLARLGQIEYDGSGYDEFELEFEQVETTTSHISQEIYDALETGILGIHIQRTSGTAAMYLTESELELEKAAPAPVPEPSTMLLFGSGILGLSWFVRRRRSKIG